MSEPSSSSPDRRIALLLGAVAFAVYAATMSRSIYTGDDGDFLVAMLTFGNCHPTGYPTFLLLGRLFITLTGPLLPEPAFGINLLTALFGAAAVAMFYRLAHQTLRDRAVAALATLLLAFSGTLWQQCLSCEVYSLTALFLVSALYLAARWAQSPDDNRRLGALAALYGLSLTNNLTMALFLPGFLGYVLWVRPGLLKQGKTLLGLVVRFVAPLSLYAYLPIAARFGHSPSNWGDPSTLTRFYEHLSGSQYRGLMFVDPLALWHLRLAAYGQQLVAEFPVPLLLLALVGLYALSRRTPKLLAVTLWVFAADVVYATNYRVSDIYVYFIPSYICVALWIGAGCQRIAEPLLRTLWQALHADETARDRHRALISIVAVTLPLLQMSQHWASNDKSGNFLETDYSQNILKSCPKDAILVTSASVTFTLEYQMWVRGVRPDVTVLAPDLLMGSLLEAREWDYEKVRRQWPGLHETYPDHKIPIPSLVSGQYIVDVIAHALRSGRPVVFLADARGDHLRLGNIPPKNDLLKPFVRTPWGLIERLYLPGTQPDDPEVLAENERLWPQLHTRSLYTGWAFNDPQQHNIPMRYFDAQKALGQLAEREGHAETARAAFGNAVRLFRDPVIDAALARLTPETARR